MHHDPWRLGCSEHFLPVDPPSSDSPSWIRLLGWSILVHPRETLAMHNLFIHTERVMKYCFAPSLLSKLSRLAAGMPGSLELLLDPCCLHVGRFCVSHSRASSLGQMRALQLELPSALSDSTIMESYSAQNRRVCQEIQQYWGKA